MHEHAIPTDGADASVLSREDFDSLLDVLRRRGYVLVGPTVRDGAILYGEISGAGELPVGLTDEQDGGRYRLRRRGDSALFGYAVGPQSIKPLQLPAESTLWRGRLDERGGVRDAAEPQPQERRYALLGLRSCELHAMEILDTVLLAGPHRDPLRETSLERPFIVAVQCGQAGGTCFCASMRTGPVAERGFDLALTELIDGGHRFLVQIGTDLGAEVLAEVPHTPAAAVDLRQATQAHENAAAQMGRQLDTDGLKELLYRNYEHPRFEEVADRCLTCGNCTMVCPTCFCTSVEDVTDLAGERVERRRRWDSCFTIDYSHIHGGPVRSSARSRYRQWMTHKLATWEDQFGTSGCVGCGRCITWCPVGIDITEEAAAIRASDLGAQAPGGGD